MMHIHVAERLEDLARSLADSLSDPLEDPMTTELVVVPTSGMRRWLSLELSRHLGTSGQGRGDGVTANIDMVFPAALVHRVLNPLDEEDPWSIGRVSWVILELLAGTAEPRAGEAPDDRDLLAELPVPAPGVTQWARARRLADLFDRYMTHRPAMVSAGARGEDIDGAADPIDPRAIWQPRLWRRVRQRIALASPAEAMPSHIRALRDGDRTAHVPDRVSLFGLTTIPGGAPLVEFLDALGEVSDVGVFLHQPSVELSSRIQRSSHPSRRTVLRSEDTSTELVRHPLSSSWGRPARETMLVLGDRRVEALAARSSEKGAETLLSRLQADIRADRAPGGDFLPDPADRSVVIHACQGDTRQVEVLRDQVLALLADDPSLSEDDVVVLCPALERFAPIIESVFGPSAQRASLPVEPHGDPPTGGPPVLRYTLSDRSLGSTYELLGSMGSLVMLLGSRFSDRALLDFAGLTTVRRRFGLDDQALSTLAGWIEKANVRWGLDAGHRADRGIPEEYDAGTWSRALERILSGIAMSSDQAALGVGHIAPIAVEGNSITVAGRVADLLARLAHLERRARGTQPIRQWLELLETASVELFAVDADRRWERRRLNDILGQIALDSNLPDRDATGDVHPTADSDSVGDTAGLDNLAHTPLSLSDVQHLLGDHLGVSAARPQFFGGGMTISSPTPLRGLPHRVVCLLGMDEIAFAVGAPDGDDLMALQSHVGDRDRRSDVRQVLLDSVLAADEHLVVFRNGRNVVTNQDLPPSVVVSEIIDALAAMVPAEHRHGFLRNLTTVHPRQRFDERNFGPGAIVRSDPDRPWSFDGSSMAAARAMRSPRTDLSFVKGRLPTRPASTGTGDAATTVALGDLREFLVSPPKFFLRRVLDMSLPSPPDDQVNATIGPAVGSSGIPPAAHGRDLVVELDFLQRWKVMDRMLGHLLAGGEIDGFETAELAGDLLPPGHLGRIILDDARACVVPVAEAASALTNPGAAPRHAGIDLELPEGTRIVGTARDDGGGSPGPAVVTVSRPKDSNDLTSWFDVVVLTAAFPEVPWRALHIARGSSRSASGPGATVRSFTFAEEDHTERRRLAEEILTTLVGIYQLGLREPLPFFPATSRTVLGERPASSKWIDDYSNTGEGTDIWVRTAFGDATFEEITSLEVLDHDPPGEAKDRTRRYAEIIWGACERSAPAQKVKLS